MRTANYKKILEESLARKRRVGDATKVVMDRLSKDVQYNPLKRVDSTLECDVFCGSIKDMQKWHI